MRILVTGSTGFIGGHVVHEALKRGHQVIALSRSSLPATRERLADSERLYRDLSVDGRLDLDGVGINTVVHLAGSVSGSAEEQYRSTVRGTENLLNAMRQAGVQRLVGISSISVLDYVAALPMSVIDESNPVSKDEREMGLYATLKAKQEVLFSAFAAEAGNQCVILRPGLVFDETRLTNAHAGIVKGPLCFLVKHEGEIPVVSVAGVASAILNAIERNIAGGHVIHLVDDRLPNQKAYLAALRRRGLLSAGGIDVPWRMLARLTTVLHATGKAVGLRGKLPEALLSQSFAARMKPFRYSNAKAKRLLGWAPDNRFS